MSEEATTPDLVKLARRGFEAMSRGDVDAVMSSFAPDAVYDLSDAGLLEPVEGEEAIRGFFEDWHRSWEDYRFEEEEILDLGHGVALTVVRESARLVGGKGRVETRVAQVYIWANGKVEWVKAYRDPDEARAAAERLAQVKARSAEPTSLDLVELNRRAIEAAVHGDFDAAMSSYAPNSVWDTSPLGMGIYRGVATIRTAFEEWFRLYADAEAEIEENVDLGNDVVLAVVRQRGRPAGRTGYAEFHFASVTEWTDGLITRVTPYTDIDEARAAAERLVESRG